MTDINDLLISQIYEYMSSTDGVIASWKIIALDIEKQHGKIKLKPDAKEELLNNLPEYEKQRIHCFRRCRQYFLWADPVGAPLSVFDRLKMLYKPKTNPMTTKEVRYAYELVFSSQLDITENELHQLFHLTKPRRKKNKFDDGTRAILNTVSLRNNPEMDIACLKQFGSLPSLPTIDSILAGEYAMLLSHPPQLELFKKADSKLFDPTPENYLDSPPSLYSPMDWARIDCPSQRIETLWFSENRLPYMRSSPYPIDDEVIYDFSEIFK